MDLLNLDHLDDSQPRQDGSRVRMYLGVGLKIGF